MNFLHRRVVTTMTLELVLKLLLRLITKKLKPLIFKFIEAPFLVRVRYHLHFLVGPVSFSSSTP